ncbi:MAG: CASTOR/POLLUX-related putative ion channel [Candidatus Rifleibacteriota bacterium]
MNNHDSNSSLAFKQRLRYRFDCLMAKGVKGQFLMLAVVGLIMLVVITLGTVILAKLVGFESLNLVNLTAKVFMLLLVPDPQFLEEEGLLLFAACVASIFGGLFVGGTLIGILTTAIDGKMEELRRGRSFVAEAGHTVILGWSSKIHRIIEEIAIANETQPGQAIAVLSKHDSIEMEEEISSQIEDFRGTNLVCRSGNPISITDLELVNLKDAKAIVILSPEEKNDPDSHIIKILLSVAKIVREEKVALNVVVEIKNSENRRICEIILKGSGIDLVTLVPDIIVPRLLVQSCRKKKLSYVYQELFDFDGDEIYFRKLSEMPGLCNKKFGEVLFGFETSSVIGIIKNGEVLLNPGSDIICEKDDEIIAITENDQTMIPCDGNFPEPDKTVIFEGDHSVSLTSERNLVLGWTSHLFTVLEELEEYMTDGSKLTLVSSFANAEEEVRKKCSSLEHYDVEFFCGDIGDRGFLETLAFEDYDNILVLPDDITHELPDEEVDALTIKCLVYVRDIANDRCINLEITSQLLAKESADVAFAARLGDFVVSDEIVGRIIAQLGKNGRLKRLFDILLTPEASEIYIKPISDYVKTGVDMNFYSVLEAARIKKEIAIGYVRGEDILVNVNKAERLKFKDDDKIIVVAED